MDYLTLTDINDFLKGKMENGRLLIRRTLQRVTMQETLEDAQDSQDTVDYGPNDSGHRELDIPRELSALLRPLLNSGKQGAYFLTGTADAPIGPRTYQYRFQSILSYCGLPAAINFYTLRNTFALMWLHQGGKIESLSLALGHASVRVTKIRYAKLLCNEKLHPQDYARLLVGFFSDIPIR